MLRRAVSRLRQTAGLLSVSAIVRIYHSSMESYQLLPTNAPLDLPRRKMKQGCLTRNTLVVLFTLSMLLAGGVSLGVPTRLSNVPTNFHLIDVTIETLQTGLNEKKFTSVDLVKAYIARTAEVNNALHAVNEINPDAISIANALDIERSSGTVRGPLHGVPILLKDIIATDDLMNNTAGSYALLGAQVPRDSTVAQKLRAAGAILLGKTNLSQWAHYRSSNTTNGWSSTGGQSYGPYYPHQDPWGSSSGSAIASALGLAFASLGTETDGSLTSPASHNNVVAIKPTVGLTSRFLVIPVSQHQDTVGPIARTVKDAAYVLQAIAGEDPHDNYTSAIPNGVIPDYVNACTTAGLSGMRIGIPRNVIDLSYTDTDGPILAAFNKALDAMRGAGAIIVEDTNFTAAVEYMSSTLYETVVAADFAVAIDAYLKELVYNPNNITSLDILQDFTQALPEEDYPARDTALWNRSLFSWNNTDPRFWPVYLHNLYLNEGGGPLGAMQQHSLDAVLLPAEYSSGWAAAAGAPIITVPLGSYPPGTPVSNNSWGLVEVAANIPFGISFMGARFTEEKLIGMAYAFEQTTNVRAKIQPYIVPSTELYHVISR